MLYETILDKFSSLFSGKDRDEIASMLKDGQDNKYLTAVVMGPYILHEEDASRKARNNFLVFMDEVRNKAGAFARKLGETPFNRLRFCYAGLTPDHPVYPILLMGENGTRTRKGIPTMDDSLPCKRMLSAEQKESLDEIKNYSLPAPNWWWNN